MSAILICVGKEFNTQMLNKCIKLASKEDATVHLLHVDTTKKAKSYHNYRKFTQRIQNYDKLRISQVLQNAILKLRNSGIKAKFHVATGPIARKIAEKATDLKADMLVMGCRTNNAFHHLVHGSIPAEVMSQTDLPVMLMPVS